MDVKIALDGAIRIEGFPDAIKIIEITDEKAKLLADLTLHQSDLLMARGCVEALETLPALDEERLAVISSALWRQAVSLFVKCFGKDARYRLNPERIYPDKAARDSVQFFKDLRDKTFQHDGNSYTQRQVLAPINAGNKPNKIEGIVAINAFFDVRGVENQRLLRQLIECAQRWVANEFDSLRDTIKAELEQLPYEELAGRPPAQLRAPTVDDMGRNRH
jgi:hypothetical protein